MNVTITVKQVDPRLLHQQYQALISAHVIAANKGYHATAAQLIGLIEFLEGIFEQNPEHFPTSETP
jgi:hypothetical protein